MKRALLPLFLSLLLLALTACGEKQAVEKDNTIVYVPAFISATNKLKEPDSIQACTAGGSFYLWGQDGSLPTLLRTSEESGKAEKLPDYEKITPPDLPNVGDGFFNTYSSSLQAAPDGTLWESGPMTVNIKEGDIYTQEYVYIFRHLDQDGRELSRLDVPGPEQFSGQFGETAVGADGTIYIRYEEEAVVLDGAGSLLFTIPLPEGHAPWCMDNRPFVVLGDGRAGVTVERGMTQEEREVCLQILNRETRQWEDPIPLVQGSNIQIFDGDANALFYYRVDNSLCAWREGAEEGEFLLNLTDADINGRNISQVSVQPDGQLLLAGKDSASGELQLVRLTPTPAYELDRKVLTMTTYWMGSELERAVQEFNRTNGEYRISVRDYSVYGDGQAARARMITEIGGGEMPDLVDLTCFGHTLDSALEDLWPYIDGDGELGRENLMVRALEAASVDGKLCSEEVSFVGLPNSWGLAGSRAILTEELGMSSACRYKEGAWAFLRTQLLPRYQPEEEIPGDPYFPINRSDFALMARQQMTPEYETGSNGSQTEIPTEFAGGYYDPLEGLRYYAAIQADYDQIMALYDAIQPPSDVDGSDILSMVREQAGAYFAGDKSLEEVSALIQNRAMLYVNERQS